ncbi:MAG: hypothetical protein ABH885_04050, partial [Candidatus Omnitrophota bacterium]
GNTFNLDTMGEVEKWRAHDSFVVVFATEGDNRFVDFDIPDRTFTPEGSESVMRKYDVIHLPKTSERFSPFLLSLGNDMLFEALSSELNRKPNNLICLKGDLMAKKTGMESKLSSLPEYTPEVIISSEEFRRFFDLSSAPIYSDIRSGMYNSHMTARQAQRFTVLGMILKQEVRALDFIGFLTPGEGEELPESEEEARLLAYDNFIEELDVIARHLTVARTVSGDLESPPKLPYRFDEFVSRYLHVNPASGARGETHHIGDDPSVMQIIVVPEFLERPGRLGFAVVMKDASGIDECIARVISEVHAETAGSVMFDTEVYNYGGQDVAICRVVLHDKADRTSLLDRYEDLGRVVVELKRRLSEQFGGQVSLDTSAIAVADQGEPADLAEFTLGAQDVSEITLSEESVLSMLQHEDAKRAVANVINRFTGKSLSAEDITEEVASVFLLGEKGLLRTQILPQLLSNVQFLMVLYPELAMRYDMQVVLRWGDRSLGSREAHAQDSRLVINMNAFLENLLVAGTCRHEAFHEMLGGTDGQALLAETTANVLEDMRPGDIGQQQQIAHAAGEIWTIIEELRGYEAQEGPIIDFLLSPYNPIDYNNKFAGLLASMLSLRSQYDDRSDPEYARERADLVAHYVAETFTGAHQDDTKTGAHYLEGNIPVLLEILRGMDGHVADMRSDNSLLYDYDDAKAYMFDNPEAAGAVLAELRAASAMEAERGLDLGVRIVYDRLTQELQDLKGSLRITGEEGIYYVTEHPEHGRGYIEKSLVDSGRIAAGVIVTDGAVVEGAETEIEKGAEIISGYVHNALIKEGAKINPGAMVVTDAEEEE